LKRPSKDPSQKDDVDLKTGEKMNIPHGSVVDILISFEIIIKKIIAIKYVTFKNNSKCYAVVYAFLILFSFSCQTFYILIYPQT